MSELKQRLTDEVKSCMKSGQKERLAVMRLVTAAIKQREVDERIELSDEQIIDVLTKMVKQRKESISQFEKADRHDLADKEKYELGIIQDYLPEALSADEVAKFVADAVSSSGAASIRDMGKVMGILTPQLKGKADMSEVSQAVKAALS